VTYALDMRILITGDWHWRCDDLAEQIINRLLARYGPELIIVHGGAPGVDNAFATACRELGIVAEPHLADWKGLGKLAGPARNREMVEASGAPTDLEHVATPKETARSAPTAARENFPMLIR
jgi:hypothetical protein